MTKIKNFLLYWGPPILWMGLIFYFSSHRRISITHKYFFDFIIFKTLHMVEYAILYFLLFRAFYSIKEKSFSLKKKFFFPFLIAVGYAFFDEIHQTFVPTREGRLRDVFFDLLGVFLMYTIIRKKRLIINIKKLL